VAQYPVITASSRLTAELLASMVDNYAIKPSDLPKTSNVTLANDPDLTTATLTANGIFAVEFHVRFAGLQAAGIKTAWSVPAGTTGNRDTLGPGSANVAEAGANTTELHWGVFPYATAVAYTNPRNNAANYTHLIEKALVSIGATAGAVVLQWAQNVTNVTATTVAANSYVKWRQVG
jgi:hypothetical protein